MREVLKQTILKRVHAHLEGYRQNIGLLSSEGMGKTELLQQVFESLVAKPSLIPVYLSAQSISIDQFAEKWMTALLRGLFISQGIEPLGHIDSLLLAADPIVPLSVTKMKNLRKNAPDRLSSYFRELMALTGILADESQKKVICILNEFHCLEDILPSIDPYSILGKEIMVQKNTLFLFASSKALYSQTIFRDKLSMLFSNFEIIRVPSLSDLEIATMISSKFFGLSCSVLLKKFLISLVGAQPVYLNLLMENFQTNASPEIPGEILTDKTIVFESLSKELYFSHGRISLIFEKRLQKYLTSLKEKNLGLQILLAISEKRKKAGVIAEFVGRKVLEVKKVLQKLEEEGVIIKRGNFFLFQDAFFEFWYREVYYKRFELCGFQDQKHAFLSTLEAYFQEFSQSDTSSFETRLSLLLKQFDNETVEFEEKKYRFPRFADLQIQSYSEDKCIIVREKNIRWAFFITPKFVEDKEITSFLVHLKQQSKPVQKKVLVVLHDIDQNAKLLAQELKMQIWNRSFLNFAFELYGQPKWIQLPDEGKHAESLGALEKSLHQA